jgi:DNA replication protein DnaC
MHESCVASVQLLIIDNCGLSPVDADARHDLLEILEERYGRDHQSAPAQFPVNKCHAFIGDPIYADAILDRIVHNAHLHQSALPFLGPRG